MHNLSAILGMATGITCHSEEVQHGNIFVAICGRSQDGNAFIDSAIARGALAIISDKAERLGPLAVPVIAVSDAREACAWLAAEFYRHPSKELSLAGVTGTNGKTTIAAMLQHMYLTAGYQAGMIGTVKVQWGNSSLPSKLTTPDAVNLQRYLRQMRNSHVTHAAMEVSAQGMELGRVRHVKFACGMLSNICPDHLDFHGSFAAYLAAKQLFPAFLAGAPLIVNATDSLCRPIAQSYSDGPVITAAVNAAADISARVIHSNRLGSVFQLEFSRQFQWLASSSELLHIRLNIPGLHNVENALLASAGALCQGVSPQAIVTALSGFGGVERRFSVCRQNEYMVIDDTALNPGSIDAVFKTIGQFRYNRLHVVNAIRGQRGPAINAANAHALACWRDCLPFTLIVTASYDHTTPADTVSEQEKTAFLAELDKRQVHYIYTQNLREAIETASLMTGPDDVLLLIGAQGMDQGYSLLSTTTLAKVNPATLPQHQAELIPC